MSANGVQGAAMDVGKYYMPDPAKAAAAMRAAPRSTPSSTPSERFQTETGPGCSVGSPPRNTRGTRVLMFVRTS